jgi:hypothetical protein
LFYLVLLFTPQRLQLVEGAARLYLYLDFLCDHHCVLYPDDVVNGNLIISTTLLIPIRVRK